MNSDTFKLNVSPEEAIKIIKKNCQKNYKVKRVKSNNKNETVLELIKKVDKEDDDLNKKFDALFVPKNFENEIIKF